MLKSFTLCLLGIFIWSELTSATRIAKNNGLLKKKLQVFRYLLRFASNEVDEMENYLKVLSWNVYSPIRINETYLASTGHDVNLVRTDIRMYVIAKRIIDIDADIVHIQEIQVDTYETLREYLKDSYDTAGFVPHGPSHWLEPGVTNVANGGTILYRKDQFVLQGSKSFQTSQSGNYAQAVTFKRIDDDGSPAGPPILSVNVHFQHGFTRADGGLRVSQGEEVHKKITEITKNLLSKQPKETPLVIVGGDFNSLTGFPGVDSFKARGYTDARIVTNNTDNSIYYPELVITSFLPPLSGLPIDTFMVPTTLVDSKKLVIRSVDVADVTDEENSEDGYITKVLSNVAADMQMGRIARNTSKAILETLVNMLSDEDDYDTLYDRAMRIGSDHVPVLATFCN